MIPRLPRPAALLVALLAALLLATSAAAAPKVERPAPADIDSAAATRAAARDPKVVAETHEHPDLVPSPTFKNERWEVGWFEGDREYALVMVDPQTGAVTESWTGDQVAWEMARGYSGEFAHSLNSPFIWVPLCLVFFVGLFDWRRRRRIANLDLLVLLGFGASHFFFNRGEIGISVPLAYPVLAYLLARCLWIGFRGRGAGLRPVWPTLWLLVAALFVMGFRVGLNMADAGAIDVGYAGVVGADKIAHGEPLYGDFPADIHSGDTYGPVNYLAYLPFERIWPYSGEWDDLPAAHGASISFDLATFALLFLLGLRIRPGPAGRRLGTILAFGWAAFPYTAYVLESDSNDALVAALLVATLVLLAKPLWRGATLALATWAKFAPAVLAPMLLTYDPTRDPSFPASKSAGDKADPHDEPVPGVPATTKPSPGGPAPPGEQGATTNPRKGSAPGEQGVRARIRRAQDALFARPPAGAPSAQPARRPAKSARPLVLFALGFAAVTVAALLWPTINPGLHTFYERTVGAQAGRSSPFSIWGQAESLEPLRIAILVATALLAVGLAFVPRRKSLLQVAALAAALMIGVQLTLQHWFYLYVVWFFPLLLVALALLEPSDEPRPDEVPDLRWPRRRRGRRGPSPARSSPPVPTG